MIVKERIPVIFYLHQYPVNEKKKFGQKRSLTPLPMDYSQCGYYSDRINNAHNSAARFYVVTFGYAKSWGDHNTYERQIDRYTIHFVFDGTGTFNGTPVSAGQMFFAPQNQKYTIVNDPQAPLVFAWIALSGTDLENQLSLLHMINKPAITQNMEQIHQIFLDTVYGQHQNLNMELFLFARFYTVLSLCNAINQPLLGPSSDRAAVYYSEAVSYINTHYAENITVSDIARHIHISVSYLRRICTEKSGRAPQEIITSKRINVAKALLANDNSQVEEIAALVGFANTGSFSKCFKRICGVAPLTYRRQKAEEKKQRADNIARTENN